MVYALKTAAWLVLSGLAWPLFCNSLTNHVLQGKNPLTRDSLFTEIAAMTSVISCPECGAKMRLKTSPTPGKKVRCPKCSTIFAAIDEDPVDDWEEEPYEPATPPPSRSNSRPKAKRKSKKPAKSGGRTVVYIAAGVLSLVVIGALVISKLGNSPQNPVAANGPSVEANPTVQRGPVITDAECQSFADALENAVSNKNSVEFRRLLNFQGVVDKSIVGIELSARDKADFMRGISTAIPQWSSQFMGQVTAGSFQRLRTITGPNGIRQVMFRLNSDDGINYYKFDLVRHPGNQIVSGDFYIYTTGEYYSTTLRRLMLPIVANQSRSILERLTGTENALVTNLPQLQQMQKLIQAGDGVGALRICKSFPQELQREKFVLLLRINAASAAGESEYISALEDFRRYHPGDVCLDLIGIDYFLLKEQYAECLACIDSLDKAVGGDPVLNLLRAPVLVQQGRYADARQSLEVLTQEEAHAEEAYLVLADVFLAENNHEETARTLTILTDRFGYQWDVESSPDFSAFVASSAYRDWSSKKSTAGSQPVTNRQSTGSSSTSGNSPSQDSPRNQPARRSTPAAPRSPSGWDEKPDRVASDFKFALLGRRTEEAKIAIAPIQGSDELIGLLDEIVGDPQNPTRRRFMPFIAQKTYIEGDVAIATSPFFGRKTGFRDAISCLYLVRIEGKWKICPTLDKPPTDDVYANDVRAIQAWIDSQTKK